MDKTTARILYDREHCVCPKCRKRPSWRTLAGAEYNRETGLIIRDRNDTHCNCGWKGEVHDLVPQ